MIKFSLYRFLIYLLNLQILYYKGIIQHVCMYIVEATDAGVGSHRYVTVFLCIMVGNADVSTLSSGQMLKQIYADRGSRGRYDTKRGEKKHMASDK